MTITLMHGDKPVRMGADVYPLERVDHLYTFTASLFEYSFKQQAMQIETFNRICEQMGLPAPEVHTIGSHGGDESDDYVAKLPDLLADAAGKQNVLVLFHGFVNDIWNHGPYPGSVDVQIERLRAMVADIKAAGHKVIISSCAYLVPFPSIHYNNAVNYPLIKELTPQYWRNDRPVFDMYHHTLTNQDMLMTDGIHPHDGGKLSFRAYTAEVLVDLCMRKPEPPKPEDFVGKKIVIALGTGIDTFTQGVNAVINAEYDGGRTDEREGYGVAYNLRATDGTVFYGTKLDQRGHSTVSTDGRAAEGDASASLKNTGVLSTTIYTANEVGPKVTISGLPNGLTGIVSIIAARNTTATNRVGNYTYKGETLQLDGAAVPPQTSSWLMLVEDGQVVIEWGAPEGTEFAYLSGISLEFVAPGTTIEVPPNDYDVVPALPTDDQVAYFLMGGTEAESEDNLVADSTENLDIVSYETIDANSLYFGTAGYAGSTVADRGGSYTLATSFTVNALVSGTSTIIGLMASPTSTAANRDYIALATNHAVIYHNGAAIGNPTHTLAAGDVVTVLTTYDADAATITMKVAINAGSILTGTATGMNARNVEAGSVLTMRRSGETVNANINYHAAAYWDYAMPLASADNVIELMRTAVNDRLAGS